MKILFYGRLDPTYKNFDTLFDEIYLKLLTKNNFSITEITEVIDVDLQTATFKGKVLSVGAPEYEERKQTGLWPWGRSAGRLRPMDPGGMPH